MNPALVPKSFLRWRAFRASSFVATLAVFAAVVSSGHAQGTMTIRFEGQPQGTRAQLGEYGESGVRFAPPAGPGSIYLSGGGISGSPNNGTGYLEAAAGNLTFGFTTFLPTTYFNLVSFDAAELGSLGPATLTVVGYPPMATPVTNYFSVNGTFQTFYLDSSFMHVNHIDILQAYFSLDNVVISGVPEPATGSLALVGAGGAVAWSRFRRKHRHRQTHA